MAVVLNLILVLTEQNGPCWNLNQVRKLWKKPLEYSVLQKCFLWGLKQSKSLSTKMETANTLSFLYNAVWFNSCLVFKRLCCCVLGCSSYPLPLLDDSVCSSWWYLTVLDRAVAWGFACMSEQLLLASVSFGKKGIIFEQTDFAYFINHWETKIFSSPLVSYGSL